MPSQRKRKADALEGEAPPSAPSTPAVAHVAQHGAPLSAGSTDSAGSGGGGAKGKRRRTDPFVTAAALDARIVEDGARNGAFEARALRAVVAGLDAEISAATGKRWRMRRLADATAERNVAARRLAALDDGSARNEAHAASAAYARWKRRHAGVLAAAAKAAAAPTGGGGGSGKQGKKVGKATAATPQPPPPRMRRFDGATAAAAALASRRVGEAPALFVRVTDVCPQCVLPLLAVANDSMLSCRGCGFTKAHAVWGGAAASAAGDGDGPLTTAKGAAAAKSNLLDAIDKAQGRESSAPLPPAVALAAAAHVALGALSQPPVVAAIAAEVTARGTLRSADDAVARLRAPLAALGVDIERALRDVTGPHAHAALVTTFAATKDASIKKAYEHAAKVAGLLSGYAPPRFSLAQEEDVKRLFAVAAPVFEAAKEKPSNVFNGGYSAFLRGVCLLRGLDEFAAWFALPKATNKTVETREAMRRNVYSVLGWEHTPLQPPWPPIRAAVA